MKCARNGCLDDAVEHISQYRADDGKPTCDLYCRDLHNADLELAEVTARLAAAEKAKHNIATELGRAIGERALALAVVEAARVIVTKWHGSHVTALKAALTEHDAARDQPRAEGGTDAR